MRDPDVIVRVSCWTVSYVPEAIHPLDAEAYSIRVEYSGHDRWAIRWLHRCLGTDGRWSHEPIPSSRTDDWLATHRFEESTALDLACDAAPDLVLHGKTALEYMAGRVGKAGR